MGTEGVTVIITAYNTEKYIEETLDSVANQTWFKSHNEWEILLGIDHCEHTLAKVKEIFHKYKNLRVFYMCENMGTYIVSNTLISKAKYARILRFDSDDIMKKDMVETMMTAMNTVKNCKLVQCYYEKYPGREGKCNTGKAHGVFLCKKSVFVSYGGFMPWKCAADTEFLTRVGSIESKDFVAIPLVMFYYRIHEESLTQKKDTDMKSELRKQYKKYIEEMSQSHPIIEMITADADEVQRETQQNEAQSKTQQNDSSKNIVSIKEETPEEKISESKQDTPNIQTVQNAEIPKKVNYVKSVISEQDKRVKKSSRVKLRLKTKSYIGV